jgi:hypothetical protein
LYLDLAAVTRKKALTICSLLVVGDRRQRIIEGSSKDEEVVEHVLWAWPR